MIQFISVSSTTKAGNTDTRAINVPAMQNGIAIATFSNFDATLNNRTISNFPTLANVNFTKVRADEISGAGGQRTEIWYLLNPTSGTQNFIWSTGGGTPTIDSGVYFINNIDQQNPIDSQGTNTGIAITSLQTNITTVASSVLLVDVMETSTGTVTADPQQILKWSQSGSSSASSIKGPLSPAGSNFTKYTFGSQNAISSVVAIKGIHKSILINNLRPRAFAPGIAR